MKRLVLGVGLLSVLACDGSAARADRIRFRGGGEIRGMILPQPGPDGKTLIQTETSARPMALDRERIESVFPEQDALDDYFQRLDSVPATADAQYQFGLWCEQRRLSGLAQEHFRRAAEIDPAHAAAQKKLGKVLHDGVWMTVAEQKRAQGLVLYKGRWISREAHERLDRREAASAETTARARELLVLRQALDSGETAQREDAERRLAEFQEPDAVPALMRVFGTEQPAHRSRLVKMLGAIPGAEARNALIECLLVEEEPAIRSAGVEELQRRDEPETVPGLVRRLDPKNPALSGRVARVLAELAAVEAVPRLIPLLVRAERRTIWVNSTTYVPPQGISVVTGNSYGVLTGPVVGNGAVAFGAYSTPFLSGVTMGSPGGGMRSQPTLRVVTIYHRNADVLAALESLTGRGFGYDAVAWRRWWSRAQGPEEPVKRVRQP